MSGTINITLYGDSILRGTVIDSNNRYHSTVEKNIQHFEQTFNTQITNRAHFGYTIEKGSRQLEKDFAAGSTPNYVFISFGGNDCNFNWDAVAAAPQEEHAPFTPVQKYTFILQSMINTVRLHGGVPIVMTLPPIDSARYLTHVSKTPTGRRAILQWLGDEDMIYRFHEMYSAAAMKTAFKNKVAVADIRSDLLARHDLAAMIGLDGIHLTAKGYEAVYQSCARFAKNLFADSKNERLPA